MYIQIPGTLEEAFSCATPNAVSYEIGAGVDQVIVGVDAYASLEKKPAAKRPNTKSALSDLNFTIASNSFSTVVE